RCGSASNAFCRHAAIVWSSLPCRRSRVLPRDKARGLKAYDIAAAMKAVTSALAGGVITPGEAATIAAELAVPDLDLIKQDEQGMRNRRERFGRGPVGQSGRPAARLAVDAFVRAIKTSDFERRLRLVEADHF